MKERGLFPWRRTFGCRGALLRWMEVSPCRGDCHCRGGLSLPRGTVLIEEHYSLGGDYYRVGTLTLRVSA